MFAAFGFPSRLSDDTTGLKATSDFLTISGRSALVINLSVGGQEGEEKKGGMG